jgi:2-C-methyl-D-erythritol 2,4-cyclodiphosphate synthase
MTPSAPPFAIGLGYDVHSFAEGRRLVLGGVTIPSPVGLAGHSDADVLLHAVCDALLGAAGLRDIGHYFPNNDAKWKNADSRVLLREVARLIGAEGWRVGNVDAMLIAEKPKLAAHVDAMKANIADDLGITAGRVGIKATTNEGMGFIGRGEGIAAMANALLMRAQR